MDHTYNALVVENETASGEALESILSSEGCHVVMVRDGEEGLRRASQDSPDFLLVGAQVPRISGLELVRRLKKQESTRGIPVVLLLGGKAADSRRKGLQAGADFLVSKPFDELELRALVHSLGRMRSLAREMEGGEKALMEVALAVQARDPESEGHCRRLGRYASLLGERCHLPADMVAALEKAGTLHDIGMVSVPDAVALKVGKLIPEEMDIIRQHPVVGERLCRHQASLARVLPIIRHHHEHFDGIGYPDALAGDKIPLAARIFAVADTYEALTSTRPYRPAYSRQEALDIMKEEISWGRLDPEIVKVWLNLAENEPQLLPERP